MATRIPAAEARKNLAEVVHKAQNGERIKLTRYDKTVAVIIPTGDLASLEDCEGEDGAKGKGRRKRTPPAKRAVVAR